MSYYGTQQENYAAGDYYWPYAAGGISLGGIVRTVAGGVKGAVSGFARGGPIGAIRGGVTGAVSAAAGKQKSTAVAKVESVPPPMIAPTMRLPAPMSPLVPSVVDVPKTTPGAVKQPGLGGLIERVLPGGQSGYVPGSAVGMGAPAGYHWNKSFSYAKGLPAGAFLVRNRQMNPVNPRALRRSIRRQQGMVALMRRTLKGSGFKITRQGLGGRKRAAKRR